MDQVKLAIFDFDGTLIRGDSIVPYIRLARRLKALGPGRMAGIVLRAPLWALKLLSDSAYKSYALKFYASLSPERQLALDRVFTDEYLLPRLFPQGKATLEARKQEGYHVVLLSASTKNYMQHVAGALGVDGLVCTLLDEGANVVENCKGENKVRLLHKYLRKKELDKDDGVDYNASCAYGDSKSDLPVLNLVGNPIIVNGKRKLVKAAPHLPRVTWQ